MKNKSNTELEELLRATPRFSEAHTEAQAEWVLREQKRLRRPARTKAIVAAILLGIVIIAYLRTL